MERHAGGNARLLAPAQAGVERYFLQREVRGALQFLSADRDGSDLLFIGSGVDEGYGAQKAAPRSAAGCPRERQVAEFADLGGAGSRSRP